MRIVKLAWTERYNCHTFQIGHGVSLHIDWKRDGWDAYVMTGERRNVGHYRDFLVAEGALIAIAREMLHQLLANLSKGE